MIIDTQDALIAEMKDRWLLFLQTVGVTDMTTAVAIYNDMITHYTENSRYYHDLGHIRNVLNAVEKMADLAEDFTAVRFAAWFHDVIYEIGAKDNEARSAEYATESLRQLGVDEQIIAHTEAHILATTHLEPSDDNDGQIVMDADLISFSFAGELFWQGSFAIRREFKDIDDETYVNGRINILKFFQSKEKLFQTDRLHTALEERARQNIAAEIEATQTAIERIRQHPNMSMDLCRLGFLLGNWQTTSALWQDGQWVTGSTTAATIHPLLDGAHLQETADYIFPDFAFRMITLYSFDKQRLIYRLATLDEEGLVDVFEGAFTNDGLVVDNCKTAVSPYRITIAPTGDDAFQVLVATSPDNGTTWHNSFKITYQRSDECESAED